jgi:RNA polymerase sigma factor (sigma-70 family)
MVDDIELLRRYTTTHSDEAFTELVKRHVNLVYSAALRQVGGDRHAAEDVTQTVFTDLARKAQKLQRHTALTGWLYTSTRYASTKVVRSARRRKTREQGAQLMDEIDHSSPANWESVRPVLDEAMCKLKEKDRQAVLFRFFEQRSLAEIGAILGVSENAAGKTVDRALERLRALLARQGVRSTAAATALLLADQAVTAAPAGLAASVGATAVTAPALAGGVFATLQAIGFTKVAIGTTTLLVASTVALLHQQTVIGELRDEIRGLRAGNVADAPPPAVATRTASAVSPSSSLATQSAATGTLDRDVETKGILRLDTFSDRGRTTPMDTLETTFWARKQVNLTALADSIAFSPVGQMRATRLFAALPDELRKEYSAPENVAAALLAEAPVPATVEVVAQTQKGTDEAVIEAKFTDTSGQTSPVKTLSYHRYADGWKTVISDSLINEAKQIIKKRPERIPASPTTAATP